MSQNDKLLHNIGLPVLSSKEKNKLRSEWQSNTYKDMKKSLQVYGKFAMLRPTGFGKTYTCAEATNLDICKDKKIIFVYQSEILKKTFDEYKTKEKNNRVIIDAKLSNGEDRIIYESYAMVGKHWGDINYLNNNLDIKNVGLIIFDEMQYMGAITYRKALDFALTYFGHTVRTDDDSNIIEKNSESELYIPYIGATATLDRKDVDVCDKYFTYDLGNNNLTYCWGNSIYTLQDAIKNGLLIPPEYQYIETNNGVINNYRKTYKALLKDLKAENVIDNTHAVFDNKHDIETAIIKNADRILHDSMLELYQCNNIYSCSDNKESLESVAKASLQKPKGLPKYMRFLVFTPGRDAMNQYRKDIKNNQVSNAQIFKGLVDETAQFFESAFNRYGYTIRTTIITSATKEERENVNLIDPDKETEKEIINNLHRNIVSESTANKIVKKENMVIDLIFSINMLNVGYHVNSITGLVLRRWTSSNNIYWQQLGRCLSVDSDTIPIVLDFVNSLSSKSIVDPIFANEKKQKSITTSSDGTTDTIYKNKKTYKRNNVLVNGVNPKWTNVVDAKYVTISTTSANLIELFGRLDAYKVNKLSIKLYEEAYRKYTSSYQYSNQRLLSNINSALSFLETLRSVIIKSGAGANGLTINYTKYMDYCASKKYPVYIEYTLLNNYIDSMKKKQLPIPVAKDINSLLVMTERKVKGEGSQLLLIIEQQKLQELKTNKKLLALLKKHNFKKEYIIVY